MEEKDTIVTLIDEDNGQPVDFTDPVNQIVGYLLSGDPTYITSYKNARYLILRVERDELLEELVRSYARKQRRDEE